MSDLASIATGAAKGAGMGLTFGPIGAAVGGLLGAAPGLLDLVGIHLGGDNGEQVAQAAMDVARTVTRKSDPQPADIADLPPDQMAQLRVQLAQIAASQVAEQNRAAEAARTSQLDGLKAQLADVVNARGQTIALAQAGSRAVWGAPVLSLVILLAFSAMLWLVLWHGIQDSERTAALANVLLGTLAAMATQVANYWLGSSSGSAAKDATIHAAMTR